MFGLLKTRLQQGHRTKVFPAKELPLAAPFRGRPILESGRCPQGCRACAEACPNEGLKFEPLRIDLGACVFCPACAQACPQNVIQWTSDHRLASTSRKGLECSAQSQNELAQALQAKTRKLFGRSFKLRQVSAAGCNGCEAELNASSNVDYDLGRFGVQFVASPRHADAIVVTGPVSNNMLKALWDTYEATPSPRLVIAVGACAISGGPFAGSDQCQGGIPKEMPIDLFIPGCPPHPFVLMDGFLRLLGRIE